MEDSTRTAIELVAQTCLYAEEAGHAGSVSVVGIDPAGDVLLPVRVRDNDWRDALASVPQLVSHIREQGHRPRVLVFCYGVGDVEILRDNALLARFANAISNIYTDTTRDAADDPDVDVVRIFGQALEARNIAMTFIGDEFTWIFDRSTSTYSGTEGHHPPVPILNVAGWGMR